MKYLAIVLVLITLFGGGFVVKKFVSKTSSNSNTEIKNDSNQISNPETVSKVGDQVSFPLNLPSGYQIGVFAKDLGKARGLALSPGGTVLVANFNSIMALVDKDQNARVEEKKVILERLDNTHGFTFFKDKLYVTEQTKVSRYNWDEKSLAASFDKKLFDLPKPGLHFTRSIVFTSDGRMYISIGSTCNACEEREPFFGSVIVSDSEGLVPKLYAKGLRNSVALTINPQTGELWGADNGRDLLGDKVPGEEINIIKDGGDYGWPYCYGERVHDLNFDPKGDSRRCQGAQSPIFEMPAHIAPLGMVFIPKEFSADWAGDLLVSQHGSWNSSVPVGYKVVRLKVEGEKITGQEDFISGFIKGAEVLGRPVGLVFDKRGDLYVSDDKSGVVYIVVKQ